MNNSEAKAILADEAVRAQADAELQAALEAHWLGEIEPWDGNEDSLLTEYPRGWDRV